MSKNTTKPTVSVKKYLVVKFIGSLSNQVGLKCVPSKWLNSSLDKILFTYYPPQKEEQKAMQLIIDNLPALTHWKTFLATLYYQTDDFDDAMLYASHYMSPNRQIQSAFVSTSTSIPNTIVDESFFGTLETTKRLTLTEQFNIISPLVASILHSIYIFSDKYNSDLSQVVDRSEHYKHLQARAVTYAKFLQTKIMSCINMYCTNAIDFDTATKKISDIMKEAVVQLLLIMNGGSE